MSLSHVKVLYGIPVRGAVTPVRVAALIAVQLKELVRASIEDGTIPDFVMADLDAILSNPDSEESDYLDKFEDEIIGKNRTGVVTRRAIATAELCMHYCTKAIQLADQGHIGVAWLRVAEAASFYGAARGVNHAVNQLQESVKATAKSGGKGKAVKVESCRQEFLKMVEEKIPPWPRTKDGVAEAVLELKPLIVSYARIHQNRVITASTDLPKKWLFDHWGLEKRSYKKKVDTAQSESAEQIQVIAS